MIGLNKARSSLLPDQPYGRSREKRKPLEGYDVVYSTNFSISSIFRIRRQVNEFESTGKGYVVFDKAFDIKNNRLPFHINMTVFIRKCHIDTAAKRHKEFMWWTKIN